MYAVVSSTFINKISAHILLPFLLKIRIPTLEQRGSYDTKSRQFRRAPVIIYVELNTNSTLLYVLLYCINIVIYLFIIVVSNDNDLNIDSSVNLLLNLHLLTKTF